MLYEVITRANIYLATNRPSDAVDVLRDLQDSVITSYSIHYTKLYDEVGEAQRLREIRLAERRAHERSCRGVVSACQGRVDAPVDAPRSRSAREDRATVNQAGRLQGFDQALVAGFSAVYDRNNFV